MVCPPVQGDNLLAKVCGLSSHTGRTKFHTCMTLVWKMKGQGQLTDAKFKYVFLLIYSLKLYTL